MMVALESSIASPCLFACSLLEARLVFARSSRKCPEKAPSCHTRADTGKVHLGLQ